MAAATGVSLNWLASGEGSMRKDTAGTSLASPHIDTELLAMIGVGIADVYRTENARISPQDQARLQARFYANLVNSCATSEERQAGLKALLGQLRQELRDPRSSESSSSKRSA